MDGSSDKMTEEPAGPGNNGIQYVQILFVIRITYAERGMDLPSGRDCIEKSSRIFSTAASSISYDSMEAKRTETNMNANSWPLLSPKSLKYR